MPIARPRLFDPTGKTDWCALLAEVQTQYIALLSGRATSAIETPMLGRVEFNKTAVGDIERLIAQLADLCAQQSGTCISRVPRGPISLEAEP